MSNTNNFYVSLLAEWFPWAQPERLQEAAALLESKTDEVAMESEFTIEMLNEATEVGHQIAQILKKDD